MTTQNLPVEHLFIIREHSYEQGIFQYLHVEYDNTAITTIHRAPLPQATQFVDQDVAKHIIKMIHDQKFPSLTLNIIRITVDRRFDRLKNGDVIFAVTPKGDINPLIFVGNIHHPCSEAYAAYDASMNQLVMVKSHSMQHFITKDESIERAKAVIAQNIEYINENKVHLAERLHALGLDRR